MSGIATGLYDQGTLIFDEHTRDTILSNPVSGLEIKAKTRGKTANCILITLQIKKVLPQAFRALDLPEDGFLDDILGVFGSVQSITKQSLQKQEIDVLKSMVKGFLNDHWIIIGRIKIRSGTPIDIIAFLNPRTQEAFYGLRHTED